MFLPDVENHDESSPYMSMIRTMRESGKEYPQIWHMFAFLPEATEHLARFTQEILHGPSSPYARHARTHRRLYVLSESLPVLTESPRRSCGGIAG